MGQTNLDELGLFQVPDGATVSDQEEHSFASVVYRSQDTLITTAQVLALNAAPITVVDAPGANRVAVFESATIFLDFNSAAYAGIAAGEDLVFKYTDGSGDEVSAHIETTGFLDQTNDEYREAYRVGVDGSALDVDITAVQNDPIVLHLLVGEIITGDSPLKVRVRYRVVDLSSLETIA